MKAKQIAINPPINPENYHAAKASWKELSIASIYLLYGKVEAIKALRGIETSLALGTAKHAIESKFPSGVDSARGLLGGYGAYLEEERNKWENNKNTDQKSINWD